MTPRVNPSPLLLHLLRLAYVCFLPSPRSAYRRVFSRREASYSGNSRRSPGERESRAPQSRTGGPEGRSSVTLNPIRSPITISSLLSVILFLPPFRSSTRVSSRASTRCAARTNRTFEILFPFFFFFFFRARALVALGGLVCNSVDSRLEPFCAVNCRRLARGPFSVPCTCTQDRDRGVERRRAATNKVSKVLD